MNGLSVATLVVLGCFCWIGGPAIVRAIRENQQEKLRREEQERKTAEAREAARLSFDEAADHRGYCSTIEGMMRQEGTVARVFVEMVTPHNGFHPCGPARPVEKTELRLQRGDVTILAIKYGECTVHVGAESFKLQDLSNDRLLALIERFHPEVERFEARMDKELEVAMQRQAEREATRRQEAAEAKAHQERREALLVTL